MSTVLRIGAVSKSFAGHNALHEISLDVPANSIYGLVGLNGAGKTTLIKCMLNLQSPDSGEIHIHGKPSIVSAARANLIYLPERFTPPDYMDGRTYLQFIIDAYLDDQQQKQNAQASIMDLCERLDFAVNALEKPVKALSKGMTQKLGIIGCLLSDKDFLILDEPMSGLDPKARALFKKVLAGLKQDGKTILLCSHILFDIETLCDQVSILHAGKLLFTGKPGSCCMQYQVQDFETAFLRCIEQAPVS
ncbi:MAG TPA: ABC transporter ATP-binding protein, partial [Gammaproteobacteria bacterium]